MNFTAIQFIENRKRQFEDAGLGEWARVTSDIEQARKLAEMGMTPDEFVSIYQNVEFTPRMTRVIGG